MDEMLYVIQLAIQMDHDNNVNQPLFNVTNTGYFIKQWMAKIVVNTNCTVHGWYFQHIHVN
jgi:hypothetical protein